jgi:uncharacterized membrane protein HdeD (DUF308 family)
MVLWISDFWWVIVLRGLLAVLFGLIVLFWSKLTLTAFTLIFSVFAVSESFLLMIAVRDPSSNKREWPILLGGIGGAIIGICAFLLPAFLSLIWPDVATQIMLVLMAAWALVAGTVEVISAFRIRREIHKEWKIMVCGVLSILLSLVLIIRLAGIEMTVRWAIGVFLVLHSVLLMMATFAIRKSSSSDKKALAVHDPTVPLESLDDRSDERL